jgi:hypothetical protein
MMSAKESGTTSISVQYFEHLAMVDEAEVMIVSMKSYAFILGVPSVKARYLEIHWSRGRLTGLQSPDCDGTMLQADHVSTVQ